jgi:2-amino-4-hydroxy-6-hydroxymethyldihydropteridine diphosphokinase
MLHHAYLCLGSNKGNRALYLERARMIIGNKIGEVLSQSKIYETEAWGISNQPLFFNQCILTVTGLSQTQLMNSIKEIETSLNRIRTGNQYESRTIDIDVLLFDSLIITTETLTIPHPRMHLRRFVLTPLCEIASEIIHPILGLSIEQLLHQCNDNLNVKICDIKKPVENRRVD